MCFYFSLHIQFCWAKHRHLLRDNIVPTIIYIISISLLLSDSISYLNKPEIYSKAGLRIVEGHNEVLLMRYTLYRCQ